MIFYNPRISTVNFSISTSKETIQVTIAKTLNPNIQGRPAPGQKVYDHDNPKWFSLTPTECLQIEKAIPSILNGSYVNTKEKNDQYKNNFCISHFSNNQPSRLIIDTAKNQQDGSIMGVTIAIINNGGSVHYMFRSEEFDLFKSFIHNGWYLLPFQSQFQEGILKAAKQKEWEEKNKNNNSNSGNNYNNQNNNNNYNYNNQNNNPQSQPSSASFNDIPVNKTPKNNQELLDKNDQSIPEKSINSLDNTSFSDW